MTKVSNLIEYDLYIPTSNPKGVAYTRERLEEIKAKLVSFFGGMTDTQHKNEGSWKVGPVTVRDEIRVFRVLSDKGQAGDEFMRNLRQELERELAQDTILVIRREVTQI